MIRCPNCNELIKDSKKRYEYKAVGLMDEAEGAPNLALLTNLLNEYAVEGWRLHSVIGNELGKMSDMSAGTNSTIEESILIFEREAAEPEELL